MSRSASSRVCVRILVVMLAAGAVTSPVVAQDDQPRWRWADFEVCGQRTVTREQIIDHLPLEIGTPYATDFESWKAWAASLEQEFDFHAVRISAVRYVDKRAFLVVNIVEHGDEDRLAFREAPTGSVLMPQALVDAQDELNVILREQFEKGTPSPENADKGYLDYALESAQPLTARLAELAPPHRETLVRIVKEDADRDKRARAATLLNWAGDVERSILELHEYVDDPDGGVRNNLTRFTLHFLDRLESPESQQAFIRAMATQLRKPGHGDRNKAVSALSRMYEFHPDTLPYIMEVAGEEIERIAEQSILSNVGGVAKNLLAAAGNN